MTESKVHQSEIHSSNKKRVFSTFIEVFGDENTVQNPIRTFFAPGRVNLIGEHTDYNGGHVLPCALTIGTYAAVRKREDSKIRLYSENFADAGIIERDINETVRDTSKSFSDYPLSVVWALKIHGYSVDTGFDIVFYGNIPYASGLSSSASVEVLTAYICRELFALTIDDVLIAKIGQYAENKFIGVNCGIMDQFVISLGKQGYATYLDTSTLEFEYIPVNLGGSKIVIACSNKKRGLGESKYNERRAECEQALIDIRNADIEDLKVQTLELKEIQALGELSNEEFDELCRYIKDDVCRKRARHAVYENTRTVDACAALRGGDLVGFGRLMNESHVSLRDDYEVTGLELDTLVSAAWEQEGVIGSRMTGAGFGGCTVSIVRNENVDAFIENVGKIYAEKTDYTADFYVVEVGGGPEELLEKKQ